MFFASPLWLLGLFPWGAATLYLFTGRPRKISVPFLGIWPAHFHQPRPRRALHVPPLAIVVALAASFLSIVAAAGPTLRRIAGTRRPVVFIVDRGFTMSARDGGAVRFLTLAKSVERPIADVLGAGPAELIFVPGGKAVPLDRTGWASRVAEAGRTAVDTRAAVGDAIRRALLRPDAMVIVLSDQKTGVADERVVQVSPETGIDNVGVSALEMRASPRPQAMVRVLNDSGRLRATLRVTAATRPMLIDLPPPSKEANYFVDLTANPAVVEALIDPGGAADADDRAWAVRGGAWPVVEARSPLTEEVRRMLDVYRRNRPARPGAPTVAVVPLSSDVPRDQPAVVVVTPGDAVGALPPGEIRSEEGPITTGVGWTAAVNAAAVAADVGPGWRRVVWVGDRTLVALREGAARQVWIGFQAPAWSSTPDFVVFWTKVLDWVGQGDDRYVSARVGALGLEWKLQGASVAKPEDNGLWPGVYRRGLTALAVNAIPVRLDPAPPTNWRGELTALAGRAPEAGIDARAWILVVAVALLLITAMLWGQR